jgi:Sulfotransferase family
MVHRLPRPIPEVARRLAWRSRTARHAIWRRRARAAGGGRPTEGALTPLLVDYYTRDGSTLLMRLLASSPQIAVERAYPYEAKYFSYLWRWSRLLERRDRPANDWGPHALGSIAQETRVPLMGPPPWDRRDLIEGDPGAESFARRCFDAAWLEFSRRATIATRVEHRRPDVAVAYYAEKHMNSWQLDLRKMPPLVMVVLLRDPRDTLVSIDAFNRARDKDLGRRRSMSEEESVTQFIARQRQRLRWIASLLEDDSVPVIRYEDLVLNLDAVAQRLERRLGVELDQAAIARDRRMPSQHGTATSPESSVGRWKHELAPELADRLARELAPELRATSDRQD